MRLSIAVTLVAVVGLLGCGSSKPENEPCVAGQRLLAPCGVCGTATAECLNGHFDNFGPCLSPPSCSSGGGAGGGGAVGGGTGGGAMGGGAGGGAAGGGSGACTDGYQELRPCGNCGSQSRSCADAGWSDWTHCAGEGECAVGAIDTKMCGSSVGACHPGVQERSCSTSCQWSSFGSCGDAGYVGPTAEQCGNGIDDDCNGSVDEGCSCSPAAPGQSGSFAVSGSISKLVADPARCFIYALNSGNPSQLVVIDEASKMELTRVSFSSTATDFDVSPDGGFLVASLDSVHQLAVVDPSTWNVTTHNVTSDPYEVEVDDNGRAFYQTLDQWTEIHKVELGGNGADTTLQTFSNYEGDLELSASGFLYSGESGISGGSLYRYNVSGGTLVNAGKSNWGYANYGFPGPARHVYLSPHAQDVYYAGFQLDGINLPFARGNLSEKVFVEDNAETLAFGESHVFDARTLAKVATFSSGITAATLAAADHELWTYSIGTGQLSYRNVADLVGPGPFGVREHMPLALSQYSLTHLVASPTRPRLYALDATRGVVVIIDSTTLQPTLEIAVGTQPSALSLDSSGDVLYVGHLYTMAVAAIDLTTETFNRFIVTDALPYGVVALANNRLATIDQDQWTKAVLRDSSGQALAGSTLVYEAALGTNANRDALWVGESGLSGSNIYRFSVANTLTQTSKSTYDMGYGFPYATYGVAVVPDGSGVFYAGYKLDGANLATLDYQVPEQIQTVTPDSRLALSSTHAFYSADGGVAAPISGSQVMAVSPDAGTLYVWTGSSVTTVDLSAIP